MLIWWLIHAIFWLSSHQCQNAKIQKEEKQTWASGPGGCLAALWPWHLQQNTRGFSGGIEMIRGFPMLPLVQIFQSHESSWTCWSMLNVAAKHELTSDLASSLHVASPSCTQTVRTACQQAYNLQSICRDLPSGPTLNRSKIPRLPVCA